MFTDIQLKTHLCNVNYYGYNLYYFNQVNKYALTCIGPTQSYFKILRLNEFFDILNDTNNTFSNCSSYNFHSLFYLSEYRKYCAFINSKCEGKTSIIYMESDNYCILQEEEQILTTLPTTGIPIATTISELEPTIPTIITSITEVETTIITTIQTTVMTNILLPINTSQIITLHLITTKISDIITTTISEIIITTFLEQRYEDKEKIYYNGKCICDISKGYYSFNNKCLRKDELPKNVYFNNKTQLYELCYAKCETCINISTFIININYNI